MSESTKGPPATLRVFRYRVGDDQIRTVIGPEELRLPQADLAAYAAQAIADSTFMLYTIPQQDDVLGGELCFVPREDECDILSIHTSDYVHRHGDRGRGLVDILGNLAGAVACGDLRALDFSEMQAESAAGTRLAGIPIEDSASLSLVREAADDALRERGIHGVLRQRTVLAVSEAATNVLLYGGGRGHMILRRLDDRLRFVITDQGDGLDFLHWNSRSAAEGPSSMGYGLKIIFDYLDEVGLHSGPSGTTLILDHKTD